MVQYYVSRNSFNEKQSPEKPEPKTESDKREKESAPEPLTQALRLALLVSEP